MHFPTAIALAALLAIPAAAQYTSVTDYLPADCPTDARVLLTDPVQAALAAETALLFHGRNSPDSLRLYAVRAGVLDTQPAARIVFGPNARLLRLPSEGAVIGLTDGTHLSGAVVDGNKYNHWPEFQELGKSDAGIRIANYCTVEDCAVFNNPGIAFFSYGSFNKISRCLAENVGYLDVKFGAMNYAGARDAWSGDGFYFRGTGNVIRECEAYDAQRWAFTSPHSGAR